MKKSLFVIILFISSYANSQVIEISGGVHNSQTHHTITYNFTNGPQVFYLLPESIKTMNFNLGLEYFNRDYYSIVSTLGHYKFGGKNPNAKYGYKPTFSLTEPVVYWESFSINTLFRLKTSNKYLTLFLEAGPRLDYIYNESESGTLLNQENPVLEQYQLFLELSSGVYTDVNRLRLGVKFSYFNHITELIYLENEDSKVISNSVNLTIGYKF